MDNNYAGVDDSDRGSRNSVGFGRNCIRFSHWLPLASLGQSAQTAAAPNNRRRSLHRRTAGRKQNNTLRASERRINLPARSLARQDRFGKLARSPN